MANLPKLPTMNGLFTWIKTKLIYFIDTLKIQESSSEHYIKLVPYSNGYLQYIDNTLVFAHNKNGWVNFYSFLPASDNAQIISKSALRLKDIYVGTGGGYFDSKITVNSAIVFNLPPQSSPPADPSPNDIYLDDGTNTADGKSHLRRYTGTGWEDI